MTLCRHPQLLPFVNEVVKSAVVTSVSAAAALVTPERLTAAGLHGMHAAHIPLAEHPECARVCRQYRRLLESAPDSETAANAILALGSALALLDDSLEDAVPPPSAAPSLPTALSSLASSTATAGDRSAGGASLDGASPAAPVPERMRRRHFDAAPRHHPLIAPQLRLQQALADSLRVLRQLPARRAATRDALMRATGVSAEAADTTLNRLEEVGARPSSSPLEREYAAFVEPLRAFRDYGSGAVGQRVDVFIPGMAEARARQSAKHGLPEQPSMKDWSFGPCFLKPPPPRALAAAAVAAAEPVRSAGAAGVAASPLPAAGALVGDAAADVVVPAAPTESAIDAPAGIVDSPHPPTPAASAAAPAATDHHHDAASGTPPSDTAPAEVSARGDEPPSAAGGASVSTIAPSRGKAAVAAPPASMPSVQQALEAAPAVATA